MLKQAEESEKKNSVKIEDIDFEKLYSEDAEIKAFNEKILKINEAMDKLEAVDYTDLESQIEELKLKLPDLQERLFNQQRRVKDEARLVTLNEELRTVNADIMAIEKEEFEISSFMKAKVELTDSTINKLFNKDVTFQMYETQENGNIVPCCKVLYRGVPYDGVNTAGRVQMGLSVIKVLSDHYGLTLPIFLDNRESVTEIPEVETQLINLIVAEEHKTLSIDVQ